MQTRNELVSGSKTEIGSIKIDLLKFRNPLRRKFFSLDEYDEYIFHIFSSYRSIHSLNTIQGFLFDSDQRKKKREKFVLHLKQFCSKNYTSIKYKLKSYYTTISRFPRVNTCNKPVFYLHLCRSTYESMLFLALNKYLIRN